jgi:hypothetical protein
VISQIVQALGELDGFVARATVQIDSRLPPSLEQSVSGISQRQHGGPVSAHTPYIVGERGPELFIPDRSGAVIPNHQLMSSTPAAGGSVTNVYVGTVYGFDDFSAKVRDAGININRLG